jgi:hypothetical protein
MLTSSATAAVVIMCNIAITSHTTKTDVQFCTVLKLKFLLDFSTYMAEQCARLYLQQPTSSEPSKQSTSKSQWNDRGIHCLPDLHWNS